MVAVAGKGAPSLRRRRATRGPIADRGHHLATRDDADRAQVRGDVACAADLRREGRRRVQPVGRAVHAQVAREQVGFGPDCGLASAAQPVARQLRPDDRRHRDDRHGHDGDPDAQASEKHAEWWARGHRTNVRYRVIGRPRTER
jgi:hypothetical protein